MGDGGRDSFAYPRILEECSYIICMEFFQKRIDIYGGLESIEKPEKFQEYSEKALIFGEICDTMSVE